MITEKLALGTAPPAGFIPLIVPEIRGNEWRYAKECLDTNWVSSVGPFVDRFEKDFAERVGVRFAVATVNGTAALHIALLVAGVKRDDEVLVSTLTFIAPANAIRYAGAWPVFIDSEPDHWQMDPQRVTDFLEKECHRHDGGLFNRHTGRRVTAIVPVHILGHPVNLEPIIKIARQFGLKVIEDATEGLGAKHNGKHLGSEGDVACFSFNGNKIITTGGGGMMVTDNEEWARRARYLTTQAKDDPVEYVHEEIGYNYRLTNLQAAIGCAQLEQLDAYVMAKRRIAAGYTGALRGLPGIVPMSEAAWAMSTFWMFTILVDEIQFGMDSRELLRFLNSRKIQARPLWQPMHRSKAHQMDTAVELPFADRLWRQALSLPCSVNLTDEQQKRVVSEIQEAAG